MGGRADLRLAERGGWIELLRGPALLFGAIARVRGWAYARRILPSYDVGTPVVCVGNVAAGGTGKTPMIAWLARELGARGRRVGIVSRGYGASDEGPNDEALMLAEVLPHVPHEQDRDRVAAATRLVDAGLDVVLLDDGFQHRRLARDVDIVLLDALRPFGLPAPPDGGAPVRAMLPRGLMREPVSALGRADAVVVTRADSAPPGRIDELRALAAEHAPDAILALASHVPVRLRARESGGWVERPLADLDGLAVELFSGIGNPGAFEATARGLGAAVEAHRAFGDHHAFTATELAGLGESVPALTTAKDAARLLASGVRAPSNLLVLDVEMEVAEGRSELEALLDTLAESDAARRRGAIHEGLHG